MIRVAKQPDASALASCVVNVDELLKAGKWRRAIEQMLLFWESGGRNKFNEVEVVGEFLYLRSESLDRCVRELKVAVAKGGKSRQKRGGKKRGGGGGGGEGGGGRKNMGAERGTERIFWEHREFGGGGALGGGYEEVQEESLPEELWRKFQENKENALVNKEKEEEEEEEEEGGGHGMIFRPDVDEGGRDKRRREEQESEEVEREREMERERRRRKEELPRDELTKLIRKEGSESADYTARLKKMLEG